MHFFYLDESGDTGKSLNDADQPIMVLGGISLRDEAWNKTHDELHKLLSRYFDGTLPEDFELHANRLLNLDGSDEFDGHSLDARTGLALDLLDLIAERKHSTHFIALDKSKIKATNCGLSLAFNPSRPYLLGFDYMITYINWFVKEKLGPTARGLMIIDEKRNSYQEKVQEITIDRRFAGAKTHRVKWITEINYAIDSKRNPMIQLSDLVVFCVRRFLEIEHGHRDAWPDDAKKFYAKAYAKIHDRLARKQLVERQGRNMDRLNTYIGEVQCLPVGQWKRRYDI